VADFIGQMNLLDGIVESVGEQVVVSSPELGSVSVGSNSQTVRQGDAVTLAVRPENLSLSDSPAPGGLAVTLRASSYFGDTTHYRVSPLEGEGSTLDVSQQDYEGPGRSGDRAWLHFDSRNFLLLKD
jgi:ABC-type Fe3+/spermidine/putrescine transport system ATPase subunit